MQKITPNLWFDNNAEEAAAFYTSVFGNSSAGALTRYGAEGAKVSGMAEGSVMTVEFQIEGFKFIALNGGPIFKFTPAVSFFLNFDPSRDPEARQRLDTLWEKLSTGGSALMSLGKYPFSERYGWIQDKFGVSWQLIMSNPGGEERPFIVPSLLFVGEVAGRAEEAIELYCSVFPDSRRGTTARYGEGQEPDKQGTIMFADFMILNQWFAAMDSAGPHQFTFNEAISLMVECKDQAEIDRYWDRLIEDGEEQPCGWLKDRFGVSWQIVPSGMKDVLQDPDLVKRERVMKAFFQMKKIDVAALKAAAGK
ncbi:VOC family protein [Dehalogenimonas sp. 4OHTPN]|uniref:VOC family protein n=1 Tax=Dehalogenimonas sp. 4OHTPN TaxID=3166643 RepID=A0AAU8G8L5_9CHLR